MIAIYLFYDIAHGIQAPLAFSKEFRHCNVITYSGDIWLIIDFDREGLQTRRLQCANGDRLLRNLKVIKEVTAIISVNIEQRHKVAWKPWWVRSCNEICRYATGIDVGFTWNPTHLYKKLLQYNGKRNYEVLSAWRRRHGNIQQSG